jgi:glutamate N-acetyltransferase/amino-acid N-acetyltransferase
VSVTAAAGFRAAGVAAGLKASGERDVALVVNDGPQHAAAAVFTSNRFLAAPVLWSKQAISDATARAVVLNSGGANACTGHQGYLDAEATATHVAAALGVEPLDVLVCSTGLIGEMLPMSVLLGGVDAAMESLDAGAGEAAARAIMTTDSHPKMAAWTSETSAGSQHVPDPSASRSASSGWRVGGMAKGAGMLAPGMATMLSVLTTDAVVDPDDLREVLTAATRLTFDRVDSDGCMSTNDTVILLASGASRIQPSHEELSSGVRAVCADLSRQLVADAEGAEHDVAITTRGAASEQDAVDVSRAVSRSNLVKTAIYGRDPNWGRILSAVGTTAATFQPDRVDVSVNGVTVCRRGEVGEDRDQVSFVDREVHIDIDLRAGQDSATVWTNDLTHAYVHENSAYST